MKFADGLVKAYEKKWSFVNSFTVQFTNIRQEMKDFVSLYSQIDLEGQSEELNLQIVSIDTPQFTNQPIEVFVANKWITQNGRDELYRFSMTFRDSDQMDLYRAFVAMYNYTKEDYFDKVSFTVILEKDGDWYDQTNENIFEFNKTLIESVSQVQFNNTTENQIAEFTVNFKTTTPLLNE